MRRLSFRRALLVGVLAGIAAVVARAVSGRSTPAAPAPSAEWPPLTPVAASASRPSGDHAPTQTKEMK